MCICLNTWQLFAYSRLTNLYGEFQSCQLIERPFDYCEPQETFTSMKFLITVCVLIGFQQWVIGQDVIRQDFDFQKALSELRTSKPDTNRISILHDLGKFYLFKAGQFKNDIDSAIYFFGEAVKLSNAQSLPIVKIRSFRNENLCRLGEAYFQKGDTIRQISALWMLLRTIMK